MTSIAYAQGPRLAQPRRSAVHWAALLAVWTTMAVSAVVFNEPAPVDFLFMILIVLLPVVGLARTDRSLLFYLGAWLVICGCGFLGAIAAYEMRMANVHIGITLFLALASFVLASFVCARPEAHTRLIVSGLLVAGTIAAVLAIVGILDLAPGAYDMFTRWSRATGTFKDPNVFGAFLVLVILLVIDRMTAGGALRALLHAGLALVLTLALVLSLSRGAFLNLVIAGAVYFYLRFVTVPRARDRMRLALLLVTGAALVVMVVVAAFSFERVGALMSSRIGLQEYDLSQEGRFVGQVQAIRVILEHPAGIGPLQFAPRYHRDSPHNVYISMFLHTGWLGGILFLLVNLVTLAMGVRFALRRTPVQGIFIAFYAAFVGHFVEGFIIDTDHWRHLFVIWAVIWGLAASPLYRSGAPPPG